MQIYEDLYNVLWYTWRCITACMYLGHRWLKQFPPCSGGGPSEYEISLFGRTDIQRWIYHTTQSRDVTLWWCIASDIIQNDTNRTFNIFMPWLHSNSCFSVHTLHTNRCDHCERCEGALRAWLKERGFKWVVGPNIYHLFHLNIFVFNFFSSHLTIYSKVHFLLRIFPAAALAAILPGAPITPPPGWAPAQNNNHEEKKDEMVIAMVFSPDHDHDHDHEEKKDVMVFSPDPQSRRPGMGVCGLEMGFLNILYHHLHHRQHHFTWPM